jgi:thymidylate kinase
MLIVIIGPDGCGKTTIANGLVSKLETKKIKANHLAMHFKILPSLKDLINPFLKSKIDDSHVEGELNVGMKAKLNSPFRGSLYVVWYALDYFLGKFKLKKYKENNEVVIFARYYYDYYYQRTHSNTPYWLINLFEFIVPRPNYVFTLDRSAENIFKLKPELSIDEIKKQQEKIKNIFKNRSNAYIIDSTDGIDSTIEQILLKMGLSDKLS